MITALRQPRATNPGARYFRPVVALLCLVVLAGGPAWAADPARKKFDVPAGDAFITLKQFSAQAGGSLL